MQEMLPRRALVTGGSSGIGAACALRLRDDGVDVVVLDTNPSADVCLDVAAFDLDQRLASAGVGTFDILVHSAAVVGPIAPLLDVSPAEWTRTIDINLSGSFNVCRAVAPAMVERG